MPKFTIEMSRIGYSFATIEVEAESLEAARAQALDEAGSHEYPETSAEFEIQYAGKSL